MGEPAVSRLAQVNAVRTVPGAVLAMVADAVVFDHCNELQHRLRRYDFQQISGSAEHGENNNPIDFPAVDSGKHSPSEERHHPNPVFE